MLWSPWATAPVPPVIAQTSRRRRRLRLELRDSGVVFRREIQQSFLGEGVGVFGKTAAAFGLFSQGS